MAEHPIQSLMKTSMESIKDMVDVNTIVGDAVETPDGAVIIPISRVTFGFAAGGGNYDPNDMPDTQISQSFGGGSGAGVSVRPVGFLVCSAASGVRFMPVEGNILYDRVIDMVPQFLNTIQEILTPKEEMSQDQGQEVVQTQ